MRPIDFDSQLKMLGKVREVDLLNKTFIEPDSADIVGKHLSVDINILQRILLRDEDALKTVPQKEVKTQITSYYSKLSNKSAKEKKRLKSVENMIELVDDQDQAEEGNPQSTKSAAPPK